MALRSNKLHRITAGLCMALLLYPLMPSAAAEVAAQTTPVPTQTPPEAAAQEPSFVGQKLESIVGATDASRDYVSGHFVGLISSIDRFFGDDRNYQESNDSVLQLDLTRISGYGGENKLVLSGRAKLHLPKTEKHLHLLIESNPDKNTTNDPTQQKTILPITVATPQSYGAGVRYEKATEDRWHYSADGGLKFQGLNTTPFARTRVSYTVPLDQWQFKAAETLFWFNTIGAGETTQFDFERVLSEPLLFRATSNATWLHDKQGFDLRQDMSLFHTLSERTALLYQASVLGSSRPPQSQVTDYVLLCLYRYRLHRDWMFFEVSPQLHFPKVRNYQSSPMILLRLEMLFDNPK